MLPVEYMHILGTGLSFISGIPAIYENVNSRNNPGKSNPLNNISVISAILLTFAGVGRLPNVFRGLIAAIKSKNKENIRRFILISLGSFFVTLTFYITLVLISIYKEETTHEEKREKNIAKWCAATFTIGFLLSIGYLINGLMRN